MRATITSACLLALVACGKESPRRTFLSPCAANADCESNLCQLGACTKSCETDAVCGEALCIQKVCAFPRQLVCAADSGCVGRYTVPPCQQAQCTESGACAIAAAPSEACADSNPCTQDGCDEKTGCTHAANTAPCDDGNACTTGDVCSNGTCVGGKAPKCDDGNICTTDSCDPKSGCKTVPTVATCDDGNMCTNGESCVAGKCTGGSEVVWNKTLGGAAVDEGRAIAVGNGLVVAVGTTSGTSLGKQVAFGGWVVAGTQKFAAEKGGNGDEAGAAVVAWGSQFAILASATGTSASGLLFWIDSGGKVLGETSFGAASPSTWTGLAMTPSQELIAVGHMNAGVADPNPVFSLFDSKGKLVVGMGIPATSSPDATTGVAVNGDAYLLTGWTSDGGGTQALAVRFTEDGKKQWGANFSPASENSRFSAAAGVPGGGWVVAGHKLVGGQDALWLVRVDVGGFVLADQTYAVATASRGLAVAVQPTGVWVAGQEIAASATTPDGFVLRTDLFLNLQWHRGFNQAGAQRWNGLAILPNSAGLALAGDDDVASAGKPDIAVRRVTEWAYAVCQPFADCTTKPVSACDDQDPCTADDCQPNGVCAHVPLKAGSVCGAGGLKCGAGTGKCGGT